MPAIKGGFIWDDDAYVSNNPTMLSFKGLLQNWKGTNVYYQYYPLVLTSFWIEYRLWGLNPIGYHITNVLIHSLNALLLFIILRGLKIKGALLASVIFALHPVCVESVAWITERKNILSLFFYLLSALSFFWFYGFSITDTNVENKLPQKPDKTSSSKHNSYFYILSLLFFVLALLSKTVTSTLPAALLLIIYWKKGRIRETRCFSIDSFLYYWNSNGIFYCLGRKTYYSR